MTTGASSLVKEKAPLILAEIKKANSILLHCHPSPDPDSVGSGLAMKYALEQLGKKATLIKGDSDIPQAFMHFPGAQDIVMKHFGEVDLAGFDLFISLDSSSPEMVSRIAMPTFPLSIPTVVIDHHATNKLYGAINLVDTTSPAVGFILFQLFKELQIQLTPEIATNLFMGIYTDTGGFKYPPTDYRILEAASELVRIAPNFTKTIFQMENSATKQSIYFKALVFNSIESYCNDTVALASVPYEAMQEKGITREDIGGDSVSNILKSVIGWNIGVSLIGFAPREIKVSCRTRDAERYDVSRLAMALGGGGHRAAAGATLEMSLSEAKEVVVKKIKELYNL